MSDLVGIPVVFMRGGTSRGPFFLTSDLPRDPKERDAVLLAAMGSPHDYQVDGIGGANPLTSKVAMISKSPRPDADVDYLFAQVLVHESLVDTKPNCGNMLVAVGPFAIEAGLVPAPPEAPPLTPREREVLRHIAAGLQNKEVAARLRLSTATVRNHVHHILDKLQVHSKLEAVSLAFQRGWVSAPAGGPEERSSVVRAAVASRRS